jgi:uncharacterized membrane protein
MKQNESKVDRIIRVVAGVVLIFLGFSTFSGWLAVVVGMLGVVLLFTGVLGFCPIYAALKLSTLKK